MTRSADEDLVARCLTGSDTAFAELVDAYKSLVFGVISQVVSDKGRIEDLAQDAFENIDRGTAFSRQLETLDLDLSDRPERLPRRCGSRVVAHLARTG